MNSKIWMAVASGQMSSAGAALRAADDNTTGADDVAGNVLVLGGNALTQLALGNERGFKSYLKLAADTIYQYLGLTPPVTTSN
jgi:hypothetical protein